MFEIDPAHARLDLFDSKMTQDIWKNKYRWQGEEHPTKTFARVVQAIFPDDLLCRNLAYHAMVAGLWLPGGRIFAGAGTSKRVTLMNCYVNERIEDSMEGIMNGLSNTALTLQQGGGIGTDFSTLRPEGALLTRTHTKASGPIPFMHTWDATSRTIRSAGDRRGAMMGTMCDTHPDLLSFIKAKQAKGALEQFNISILVSDALMEAVKEDAEWLLYFPVMPMQRDATLEQYDFTDDDGVKQFVYQVLRARDLWEEITRATYEYSEPGVIFIDRINEANNLWYCEDIRCTNPCVTGDTMVLTDKGHLPIRWLSGQLTNVWNGQEWSEVTPFSTGENELYEVAFSNGQTIRCTPYHKWLMQDGTRKEARTLQVKDELACAEFPIVVDGTDFTIDAYSQGFYCGDGTKNSTYSNLYKHNEGIRSRLVGKMYNRNCESQPGYRWVHGTMLPKDFVPVTANVNYCVNWLAGLLDADGTVSKKRTTSVLEITAKDRNFLRRIGLMLTRLGVGCRMWERKDAGLKEGSNGKTYVCENTASLMIAHKGANQLVQLGMCTERINLAPFQSAPKGIARVGQKVVSITKLPFKEETFCLNEPKCHTFIANGTLTSNCGEQPLPPHGTCNLGHVNLARVVKGPFTKDAYIDYELIKEVVQIGTRFLDAVIDASSYPLPQQELEEKTKRRLGLGFTGLADMLAQLTIRYGSREAVKITEDVTRAICFTAYETSIELAKEKGAFDVLEPEYLTGHNFAATMLPEHLREGIREHGIRNSLLLTVAPTGTGSIFYGNVSSGGEPVFLHSSQRKVLKPSDGFKDEWETYVEWGYGARLYHSIFGADADLPPYMVTAEDLTVEEHVAMQAAAQRWIDSSMSKTINVPKDYPYEQFAKVYELAYTLGCKGCTTYRPSDLRGSVLSAPDGGSSPVGNNGTNKLKERPHFVAGGTYKLKWPSLQSALYLTINGEPDRPTEIFLASKDARYHDWMTALTTMISSIYRRGGETHYVAQELQQIQSLNDSFFLEERHHPSLAAYVGFKLEQHITGHQITPQPETPPAIRHSISGKCPQCHKLTLTRQEGCTKCLTCDYTTCG